MNTFEELLVDPNEKDNADSAHDSEDGKIMSVCVCN